MNLFHEIILGPYLLDLVELRLNLVDVVLFVLEDLLQQFAGTVVTCLHCQPDALVIALYSHLLGAQVVGVHLGCLVADMDLVEGVHDRPAVQKENTGLRLLHFHELGTRERADRAGFYAEVRGDVTAVLADDECLHDLP